jgi:hypothetical protein
MLSQSLFQAAWYVIAVLLLILFAALRYFYPLAGDQTLFLLGAKLMAEGKTLYIDFWDIKQPGIFYLYQLGGSLFGFTQQGIRSLDAAWMLLGSFVIFVVLRRYYYHRWLSAVVPVAAFVSYYAFSWNWQLSQLEIFVALPIFVSLWLLTGRHRAGRARTLRFLLSGAIAGGVVTFKLALAPIFIVAFALAVIETAPQRRPLPLLLHGLRLLAVYAAGVFAVLGAVCLVFWVKGALEELLWTSFVFPFHAIAETQGKPLLRLVRGLAWFATSLFPWLLLAVFTLPRLLKADEPMLTRLMLVWFAVGFVSIVLQSFSWYEYHYLLLFLPVAVLGVRGLDLLLQRLSERLGDERPWTMRGASAFLCLLAIAPVVPAGVSAAFDHLRAFRLDRIGVEGFRAEHGRFYAEASRAAEIIRNDPQPGDIYVFGYPLIYLKSGRAPALPISGWTWEYHIQSEWAALPGELQQAAPAFIYVEQMYDEMLGRQAPEVVTMLRQDYQPVHADRMGTLYRRTVPAVPAG